MWPAGKDVGLMPDFRRMRLGRLPHDPERLAGAPGLDGHAMALAPPPGRLDCRRTVAYAPQLDRNDQIGDCGLVGLANGARADAALQGFRLNITTETVVGWYSRFGYPAQDNGTVLLDVLASQAQHALQAEDQLPLTGPYATIDPQDRPMLARVMARVGWSYVGVNLAAADQVAEVWDTATPASAGDPTPGTWGRHCLDLLYYDGLDDTDLVYIATWGMIHPATWRWVRSRLDEAHAVIWRPLAGIDYDRLCADVAAIAA
jgi:hypothetical protein